MFGTDVPTSAVSKKTPFELWHGKKPDVSHLRIWGCTAYVHVQKDKRTALGSHMEKCIFIGYPDGYKGWKFYNPITKKTVISERAEFDERYMLGSHSVQRPQETRNDTRDIHSEQHRLWNEKLHSALLDMGFNRICSDPALYIYQRDDVQIIMPVYVDDITLASNSQAALDKVVSDLSKYFKLKDLGADVILAWGGY
jgi:hypothetical protein